MKYESAYLRGDSFGGTCHRWPELYSFKSLTGRLFVMPCLIAVLTFLCQIAVADTKVGNSEYLLGSGDKIQIRVYGEDELSMESFLSDSGVINYPFLGEVKVAGLTTTGLEAVIERGLKNGYLIKPIVHISVIEYRPFFIDGEVKVPGGYPYQPGLTIEKAVALAKGFTERAAKEKISIIRGEGKSREKIQVDLSAELRPGDIITVEQRFF